MMSLTGHRYLFLKRTAEAISAEEESSLNIRRGIGPSIFVVASLLLMTLSVPVRAGTNIFGGSGLFLTHSADVGEPGEWRLGLYGHGYEYKLPEDPEDWDIVPVLNYTPTENMEIMFNLPYRSHDDGESTRDGIADGFLGLKYRFHPRIAALVYSSLGWGKDYLGPHSGQTDLGVMAVFSQPLGSARLDLNAGYEFSDLEDDIVSDRVTWGVGLSVPVMEKARLFGEWTGYSATEVSAPAPSGWTAGIIYGINENLELTVGGGSGVNGDGPASPDWRAFAGLTYTFGKAAEIAPPPAPAPAPPPPAPAPAPTPPPPPPAPAPAPAPPPPPPPPPAPPVDTGLQKTKQRIELVLVRFPYDRIFLSPEGEEKLDEIIMDLKKYPEIRLTVIGHADSRGTASYNSILGKRRAEVVRDYLVMKGIDASRLAVTSDGEMKPLASNETKGGMVQNRRASFSVQLP
jgi:outer membrane protein OmpA-like peptidoglycan-associated protein